VDTLPFDYSDVFSAGSVHLPSSKFDPILRTFRVIKLTPRRLLKQSDHPRQAATVDTSEPEKCVTCDVLYDPSPEPFRADVVFIHGLHGSLDKTWKQAVWDVRKIRTVSMRQRNVQPATLDEDTQGNNVVKDNQLGRDQEDDRVKRLYLVAVAATAAVVVVVVVVATVVVEAVVAVVVVVLVMVVVVVVVEFMVPAVAVIIAGV
jgi:hypothetical protein